MTALEAIDYDQIVPYLANTEIIESLEDLKGFIGAV